MSEIGKKNSFPLKVGITGGIGSGKTTVCKIFESLGIPVYYADDRAKLLMVENQAVRSKIIALFGTEAYLPDGKLNRQFIASIVFQDKKKLEKLNAIVHPAVLQDGKQWHTAQTGAPYSLKEAALLIESGSHKALDKLIVVTAPPELRIQRVMERDGVPREAVEARISKQLPEEEKLKLADFVIENDGTKMLTTQVLKIHRLLMGRIPSAK